MLIYVFDGGDEVEHLRGNIFVNDFRILITRLVTALTFNYFWGGYFRWLISVRESNFLLQNLELITDWKTDNAKIYWLIPESISIVTIIKIINRKLT